MLQGCGRCMESGGQSPRIFLKALSVKAVLLSCPFPMAEPSGLPVMEQRRNPGLYTRAHAPLPPQEMRTSEHNSTSSCALGELALHMGRPWRGPWPTTLPSSSPWLQAPLTHKETETVTCPHAHSKLGTKQRLEAHTQMLAATLDALFKSIGEISGLPPQSPVPLAWMILKHRGVADLPGIL